MGQSLENIDKDLARTLLALFSARLYLSPHPCWTYIAQFVKDPSKAFFIKEFPHPQHLITLNI